MIFELQLSRGRTEFIEIVFINTVEYLAPNVEIVIPSPDFSNQIDITKPIILDAVLKSKAPDNLAYKWSWDSVIDIDSIGIIPDLNKKFIKILPFTL